MRTEEAPRIAVIFFLVFSRFSMGEKRSKLGFNDPLLPRSYPI